LSLWIAYEMAETEDVPFEDILKRAVQKPK